MLTIHDVPGEHKMFVRLPSYAKATDDGKQDVVFVAPFDCDVTGVKVYFQGTASVGAATNYFVLTLYKGTAPVGSASFDSAVAFRTGTTLGSASCSSGDVLTVGYGTVGTGLDAPGSIVEITYEGD